MAEVMVVVAEVMLRRWKWGEADCCTSACDVFLRLHGVDPMEPLRGAYSSRTGADLLIDGGGGMEALAVSLARLAGLREGIGGAGEIGVGEARCFLIGTGEGWVGKTANGFATVPRAVRSWRV